MKHSNYYDLEGIEAAVARGGHREVIGGLWDQIGDHQMQFLITQGLRTSDRFLDIGCGSLRLGSRAIAWLDPERYFGTDLSAALIEAGRNAELDENLRAKAPSSHFAVNDDFDFGFLPQPVNMAIAQSVFTHLPLNHLRRCLSKLAPHMVTGGRLFVTYFECHPEADLFSPIVQAPGGIVTHDFKDPYHYRLADLEWATDAETWRFEPIGDWGHPRAQRIASFLRL